MTIEYLSIQQAARHAKIPYENFRYHVNKGRIPIAAKQGERRLFIKEDIDGCDLIKTLKKKMKKKVK